jgi:UDP-N-acetylglucosamine--N-acetylmuramyl-(pentapeptide) pyrophosphoryl-undecaprenol N-acetylglucosamine transferase
MGGSQGARGVNRVVGSALPAFELMGIQLLHITGPTDYEEARDVYAKYPLLPQHVAAFLPPHGPRLPRRRPRHRPRWCLLTR